jgi:hypothetical protein
LGLHGHSTPSDLEDHVNTTYGNMTLADELMHPADDHPQYNESALLTFFDPAQRTGGYLRIGNRPNEGHAEATLCWFLPDGSTIFSFDRAPIDGNTSFRTGQIEVETIDVGKTMRATFRGEGHHLAQASLLTDPKRAFTESPVVPVEIDLVLTGLSPLYGGTPFPGLDVGGHYEQHMRIDGQIRLPDQDLTIVGYGNRDHSWGPRVWQGTACDRTLWCTFDESFGLATSLTWKGSAPDEYEVIGYVWRDETMTRIVDASMHSRYADDRRIFHTGFDARLHLEDGTSLSMQADVLDLAPLRHRRGDQTTHIGWAMAEFRCNGRRGVGLSEYMDQGGPS